MIETLDYRTLSNEETEKMIHQLPNKGRHYRATTDENFAQILAQIGVPHVLVSVAYLQQFAGPDEGAENRN